VPGIVGHADAEQAARWENPFGKGRNGPGGPDRVSYRDQLALRHFDWPRPSQPPQVKKQRDSLEMVRLFLGFVTSLRYGILTGQDHRSRRR
jgi:hypothetical protein